MENELDPKISYNLMCGHCDGGTHTHYSHMDYSTTGDEGFDLFYTCEMCPGVSCLEIRHHEGMTSIKINAIPKSEMLRIDHGKVASPRTLWPRAVFS